MSIGINMTKLRAIKFIILFFIFISQTNITAQEQDSTDIQRMPIKLKLPGIPKGENKKFKLFEDEISYNITKVLKELDLYEIAAGTIVDSTTEISSRVYKANYLRIRLFYHESIAVASSGIYQEVIPVEEDDTYFSLKEPIVKIGKRNKDTDNFYTEISTLLYFIDNKTSELLGELEIIATHFGGNKEESKKQALKDFRKILRIELKRYYYFSADIDSTKNGEIVVSLGTDHGMEKGLLFEIVEPERIWIDGGEEYLIPSATVGFAAVVDTTGNNSKLKILRQWQPYYDESWVVLCPEPIYAVQLNYNPPNNNSYATLGIQFHAKPLQPLDWGLGIQINQMRDSYNDKNHGIGFNLFGLITNWLGKVFYMSIFLLTWFLLKDTAKLKVKTKFVSLWDLIENLLFAYLFGPTETP